MDADQSTSAPLRVRFDARVYALPAIKKAAYRFLKSFDTEITQEGDCVGLHAEVLRTCQRGGDRARGAGASS